jgi:hypothetical protein
MEIWHIGEKLVSPADLQELEHDEVIVLGYLHPPTSTEVGEYIYKWIRSYRYIRHIYRTLDE